MTQTPVAQREATWLDFSHTDENASPGHYSVRSTSGVSVELTASARAGYARIGFPKGAVRGLLIEAGKTAGTVTEGDMHVISPQRVVGSLSSAGFCWKQPTATYKVHMAVQFDQAIIASTWYGEGIWKAGAKDAQGASNGLHLQFASNDERPLRAVVAISYVSVENALMNLEASLKETSFERVRAQAQTTWNRYLNRIKVQGASQVDKRIFNTALYHSLLHPNVFSDVNGQYMGLDGKVHAAQGYTHYANFSGWDIYRTWIQLVALLAPDQAHDLMRSFVVNAQQCGGFPR